MRAPGISGNILYWVESWLSNSKQRVALNGKFSSWVEPIGKCPRSSALHYPHKRHRRGGEMRGYYEEVGDDTKIDQQMKTAKDKEKMQEALGNGI
jgi:hypothetical protein